MRIESMIKFRIYAFFVAGFVVLALIIGALYAFLATLFAFFSWKSYKWLKLMRWWKSESDSTRQIVEYIVARLNEGRSSNNMWIQSLTEPEVADFAREYRLELIARPIIIEKESSNLIEGWTEWGATRLEDCVLRLPADELANNVGSKENPIPFLKVMIAKTAFEILIAEHALGIFNAVNPRQLVSRRLASKELEKLNSNDSLSRPFVADMSATTMRLLAQELGE